MWVIDELKDYISTSNNTTTNVHIQTDNKTNIEEDDEIWSAIDKKISETTIQVTPLSSAASIVKRYLNLPYIE